MKFIQLLSMCKLFEIEHLAEKIYLLNSTFKDLHVEIESRVEYAPLQYIECQCWLNSIILNPNAICILQIQHRLYNIVIISLSLSIFHTAKHHRNQKRALLPRVEIPKVLSESNLIQDSWKIGTLYRGWHFSIQFCQTSKFYSRF